MGKRHFVTPTEEAYYKQLKRIKQFVYRAEKRGYIFSENVIPKKPQKIKPASVRKLARITPEKLYKKAAYVSELTYGEIVKAKKGRELEKKKAQEKRKETIRRKKEEKKRKKPKKPVKPLDFTDNVSRETLDTNGYAQVVILNFLSALEKYVRAEGYGILRRVIDDEIEKNGTNKVAKMITDMTNENGMIDGFVMYNETVLTTYISKMLKYIPINEETRTELYNALDNGEDFNDYEE